MWGILLQTAAVLVAGITIGYGFAAIVSALAKAFADLWQGLVIAATKIFGYLRDATKHYLALLAQFLDKNWPTIQLYLQKKFGYRSHWLIGIFRYGLNVLIAITDPKQNKSEIVSMIALDSKQQAEIQLPTLQNPAIAVLVGGLS